MDDGTWSNAYDGLGKRAGAQQAKPATDREAIEDAIKVLNVPTADYEQRVALGVLMRAARKHLETLPKPVWRVTGILANGNRAADYESNSHKMALDFARDYLAQGVLGVSVRQVKP